MIKHSFPGERMEMDEEILPTQTMKNARAEQHAVLNRKVYLLFFLTAVNLLLTLAVASFIALSSNSNAKQFVKVQNDLKMQREKISELEKQQQKKEQKEKAAQQTKADKDLVNGIKTKVTEIEQQQREQQIFNSILKDRFGNELLTAVHPNVRQSIAQQFANPPQNRWDANATHSDLEIFGNESLKVHYIGEGSGVRSVFAKLPIPSFGALGIFYFEIRAINVKDFCSVGFATKAMPLDGSGGQNSADICALQNNGQFRCPNVSNIYANAMFSRGDFVGCGVNLATRRIIFTKNGRTFDTSNLFLGPSSADFPFFPFVSLGDFGDLIEANFGPKFKFDPTKAQAFLKLRMGNFWDHNACHGDIEIVGSDRLTVRHKGNGWHSVFAEHPIELNKSINPYFEIFIKQKNCCFSFGFAFKQLNKLDASIHRSSGTYAWRSDGVFWIDGSMEGPYDKYTFGDADVVGIGIHLANRQMIFTKNGLRLGLSFFVAPSSTAVYDLFFPFVSLDALGDEIEANFGPNFKFILPTL